MRRALITGASGQDGAYLARLLLAKGYEVHGSVRPDSIDPSARLRLLGVTQGVALHRLALEDMTGLRSLLEALRPHEIYNFASQSSVAISFAQPRQTAQVNGLAVIEILEWMRLSGRDSRFYQASSSEMFGAGTQLPQSETTPFAPRSPYAVAKLFAHWTTVNYRETYGLHASSGILFNHESPLRSKTYVTRKITSALAAMAAGEGDVLALGALDGRRDFGFAGDYVEGMWLMLQQREASDYILASGRTFSIREFVEKAALHFGWRIVWEGSGLEETGRDARTGRLLVRVDPRFYRPAEPGDLRGDPGKARDRLNWSPRVDFDALVAMMAEDDARQAGLDTRALSAGTAPA